MMGGADKELAKAMELLEVYNELMKKVWEYYSTAYGQPVKAMPSTSSQPTCQRA